MKIPEDLLLEYYCAIKMMEKTRQCPEYYKMADKKRQKCHDLILEKMGKSRDDDAFEIKLAMAIDKINDKLGGGYE